MKMLKRRLNPAIPTLKADSIVEHKLLNPNPHSLQYLSLRNINEHRIIDGSCSFRESHRRVTLTMKKKLLIAASGSPFFRSNNKPQSFEVSNSVGSSNVRWRGLSYAASVPSDDTPNAQKGRKRITKHERRAMVEAFVNKYRAMNEGKFPTAKDVIKQVGGGYYAVRDIIQELEYKSKMNSNRVNENLLENEQLVSSKFLTTESVKVSSGDTRTAKDGPIQDDSRLVVLDDKETINTGCKNVEGQSHTYLDRRLSEEVEIMSTKGNHCIASESNLLEKGYEEPYSSSLQKPNEVKAEGAVSRYFGSVPPESHLPLEEKRCVSAACSENYGIVNGNIQGQESESVEMGNHKIKEEKCIEKTVYNRREQAALEKLFQEPSKSSFQVPNDVKTEVVSSHSSDSTSLEKHLPKEIEHGFAPFIEKPGSSHVEAQSRFSEFVNMENHPINKEQSIEKVGYEKKKHDALKDFPGADGPKHKMEQSQGPSKLDESKIDNSNNRETNAVVVSEKSTLWGNLKSLADGIINMWRKS